MLVSNDACTAAKNDTVSMVDDQTYTGREYIGDAPKPGTPGYGQKVSGEEGAPQAYLVMQPPHSVARPYFHQTKQFQVFVNGGGAVGKSRVEPLTVQYAGANTPYGPIQAEAEGVDYFTLRQRWDSGAKYLPEKTDMLIRGKQRQVVGGKAASDAEGLPRLGEDPRRETLIEPADDGLYAEWLSVAPGGKSVLPNAGAGGGQYHVVVSSALRRNDKELPRLSVEFAGPDEGVVEVKAGANGLELLLLRFPKI
jgi:hypothetical protein